MTREVRQRLRWFLGLVGLLSLVLITGCGGIQARVELKTHFNMLGGGEHQMVLAVPAEFYSGEVLDAFPDFSFITGVSVHDYRSSGWQGMQVSQSFYFLEQLNRDPERAHFLNGHYTGAPIAFRSKWHQRFFTRDLDVMVLVNTSSSNALVAALTSVSSVFFDATYVLEMPGRVVQHNGTLLDARTVQWAFDPNMPQTLQARARVVDIPSVLALAFTLGSGGMAFFSWKGQRVGPRRSVSSPRGAIPRRLPHRSLPGARTSTRPPARASSRPSTASRKPPRR